jgi:hypothetical protein
MLERWSVTLLVGTVGCHAGDHQLPPPRPVATSATSVGAANAAPTTASLPPTGVTTSTGRVTLDGERVYWLAVDAHADPLRDRPTRLLARPKAGGDTVELAVVPTEAASALAGDDAEIYLGYRGQQVENPDRCRHGGLCSRPSTIPGPTGAIVAVPKGGGPVRVIASGLRDPHALAIDGAHVYWAEQGQVRRAPKRGGPSTVLAADVPCHRLLVDTAFVYCSDRGVLRLAKDGARRERLGDPQPVSSMALGLEVIHVGGQREIPRDTPRREVGQGLQSLQERMVDRVPRFSAIPLDGGPTRTLLEEVSPWWMVTDGARVYWSTGSGAIQRLETSGGAAAEPVSANAGSIEGLAVDEARVYWSTPEGALESAPR